MKAFFVASLALFGTLILAIGAAQAGSEKPMSQDEVIALLSDHTEKHPNGAGYYSPDGVFLALSRGQKVSGKWRVNTDGVVCLKVEAWFGNSEKCMWKYLDGGDDIVTHNQSRNRTVRIPRNSYRKGNKL